MKIKKECCHCELGCGYVLLLGCVTCVCKCAYVCASAPVCVCRWGLTAMEQTKEKQRAFY